MSFIKAFYSSVLDSLFPVSIAEQAVLSMDAKTALKNLPRAVKCPIPEACSIFSYKDERVSRLIWSLKYKRSMRSAKLIGEILDVFIERISLTGKPIIIVPMPITNRRRRERGYNQCELILNALTATSGVITCRDLLIRTQHRSRQTLKDREHRLKSAHDLFQTEDETAERLLDKFNDQQPLVIVIDDVITTGSTMIEAVASVRNAGFPQTFGLSIAH